MHWMDRAPVAPVFKGDTLLPLGRIARTISSLPSTTSAPAQHHIVCDLRNAAFQLSNKILIPASRPPAAASRPLPPPCASSYESERRILLHCLENAGTGQPGRRRPTKSAR